MSELETRIKQLERELALKNAYLSVTVSFGKGNRIPDDVKEEVTTKLRELCTKLAEDRENSLDSGKPVASQFSEEEVTILKGVVDKVKSVQNVAKSIPTSPAQAVAAVAPQEQSQDMGLRKARIITLEGVPQALRAKMAPDEEVYVKSVKGDRAMITNKHGQSGYVPLDNLEIV